MKDLAIDLDRSLIIPNVPVKDVLSEHALVGDERVVVIECDKRDMAVVIGRTLLKGKLQRVGLLLARQVDKLTRAEQLDTGARLRDI